VNRTLDVATSLLASVARLGAGISVADLGARPEKPLELYEFEACPYCRKVREAACALDLELLVRPCPKGGKRFREAVVAMGGKAQFPYLVDSNTGISMYESDDIVRYLFDRYGKGSVPALLSGGPLNQIGLVLPSGLRPGLGLRAERSRAPEQPLELASFEGSPYCRIAREKLCSLELPYRLRNVAKGSPSREAFVKRSGRMQVPWLHDPNTGTSLFESADIVRYLDATYRAGA
jgi:glutathione S-transferase